MCHMLDWSRQWPLDPWKNKNTEQLYRDITIRTHIQCRLQPCEMIFKCSFDFCLHCLSTWDLNTICSACSKVNHLFELWMFKSLKRLQKKTKLVNKMILEGKPMVTWLVATSHSIIVQWKAFSEYGTTCSGIFFSLRSRSRVRVATSAAALRFLTSPGSFDSYLFFFAQLRYHAWKTSIYDADHLSKWLTGWSTFKWRRKVVTSSTMHRLSLQN